MEQALVIHMANKLAALEDAKAAAPTASPTWRGLDAVEAATREVVAAAHALVAAFSPMPSVKAVEPEPPAYGETSARLVRIGRYVLNMDKVNYFYVGDDMVQAFFGDGDDVQFTGEWYGAMRAWLDCNHDEDMGPATYVAEEGQQ